MSTSTTTNNSTTPTTNNNNNNNYNSNNSNCNLPISNINNNINYQHATIQRPITATQLSASANTLASISQHHTSGGVSGAAASTSNNSTHAPPSHTTSSTTTSSVATSILPYLSGTHKYPPLLRAMTATSIASSPHQQDPVLQGYLRKMKTMKKKYFALYADHLSAMSGGGVGNLAGGGGSGSGGATLTAATATAPSLAARLEYYDTEKKFRTRAGNPKRCIELKSCFNITWRQDTKHKFVLALYTREDCFCIVFDTEPLLNSWLKQMQMLRGNKGSPFEYVWQVKVQRNPFSIEKGITGTYHLCLTEKSITLVRTGNNDSRIPNVEFLLTTIRRCGDSQGVFYMEVGRHSAIGAGELWMETEDIDTAKNMHQIIINAMSASVKNSRDDFGPITRNRSSSANEASKPISMLHRRQTQGSKAMNFSPSGGTAMGRERCDSLPSRNRTTSENSNQCYHNSSSMPPPRMIPSNRPHSMYTSRLSHSPPVNSACPLSPSGGCSESDGSSLSIDEADGFGHSSTPDETNNFSRYYNSRPSGIAIPEENFDDCGPERNYMNANNARPTLSLLIQPQMPRKGSPAPPPTTNSGITRDMYSPCGSSPGDQVDNGYMPMSPDDIPYLGSTGVHSGASSLAEEPDEDGYVPMTAQQGYVDMEGPHARVRYISGGATTTHGITNGGMSSAASSCSITSGTPSTDMRFAEYHLDKVTSRFTPDDEESSSITERPMRAYSVGSRLEHNKRKLRIDQLNADAVNSRTRAYSVGSRAKIPKYHGADFYNRPAQSQLVAAGTSVQDITSLQAAKGKKSTSAPLLVHKSQNSVDHMSDLMEIDFSRTSDSASSSPIKTSLPVPVPATNKNVDINGYVEMKPIGSFTSDSPLVGSHHEEGYMDMRPVAISKSPSLSCSPVKSMSSPKTVPFNASTLLLKEDDTYMDMKPGNGGVGNTLSSSPQSSVEDYLNYLNIGTTEHNDAISKTSSAPEGYMEMSWGKNTPRSNPTNNNNNIEKPSSDEYINMSFGSQEKRSKRDSRLSSPPIAIQSNKTKQNSRLNAQRTANFLPTLKTPRSRCDSRDSGIVTPSGSHPTIFSPSSPMKQFTGSQEKLDRKTTLSEEESSDDSGAKALDNPLETLSNDYADMTLGSRRDSQTVEYPDYVNCAPKSDTCPTPTRSLSIHAEDESGDYAIMNPIASRKTSVASLTSCDNTTLPQKSKKSLLVTVTNQDTVMSTQTSFKPITSTDDRTGGATLMHRASMPSALGNLTDDKKQIILRPNSVNSGVEKTKSASNSNLNRPNSANSDRLPPAILASFSSSTLYASSSSSSTLCGSKSQSPLCSGRPQSFSEVHNTSRPESVTSMSDQHMTSRPPSVSSERELHYASLDLPASRQNSDADKPAVAPTATAETSSSSPSPNANSASAQQPTFTYAQIDFNKCEMLKKNQK